MNIFLPELTVSESIKALDNKRLNKQILECYAILKANVYGNKGYANHCVTKYYKDYPWFITSYGILACAEYSYRHNYEKKHLLYDEFLKMQQYLLKLNIVDKSNIKAFYAEGSITDSNCIRTTENTVELFRQKLCNKWDNDKYPPKWTNREPPAWYKKKGE